MKKLLLLSAFMGLAILAKAQSTTYHAFKFDIGIGYASPTANSNGGTKAGATFTLQPHYRLSDDFALGLRLEGAGLGYVDNSATSDKAKVHLLESYCATGEYYLMKGGFRPFVGAGAGFFAQSALQKESGSEQLVASSTNFGFFPEVGFEAGHFRMSADYDVAGSNNNYVAVKIGFFFGGGKK
jgi:outer membrane protein W